MRRIAVVTAVLVLVPLLASCTWTEEDTRSATAGLPDVTQQLAAHDWRLDPADSSIEPAPTVATLVFDPRGEVSGSGGCNAFGASFTVDDDRLEIGPPRQTLISCGERIDRAETAYLQALPEVHEVDATDRDRLVLTGGDVRLSFVAADEPAG